jgi:hypothetical protein
MPASRPIHLRALERSQYEFDFEKAPFREHLLYAYAPSDEDMSRASSARLRKHFEEVFRFTWYDPERRELRLKRLKGFAGDYYWKGGTLSFILRGPPIPFFGLAASQLCRGVPIMYYSVILDGPESDPHYFLDGEERFDGMDKELAGKFAELRKKQWGIITGSRSTGRNG